MGLKGTVSQRAAGMDVAKEPSRRVGAYQFDDLTTGDIFYKVHGLRRGVLDLTEDEHLRPKSPSEADSRWHWVPEGLTIWDISWVYLYSLGKAILSEARPLWMRTRIVGRTDARWTGWNSARDRSHDPILRFISSKREVWTTQKGNTECIFSKTSHRHASGCTLSIQTLTSSCKIRDPGDVLALFWPLLPRSWEMCITTLPMRLNPLQRDCLRTLHNSCNFRVYRHPTIRT